MPQSVAVECEVGLGAGQHQHHAWASVPMCPCRFQDGAATANNPAAIAVQEALLLWPDTPIDCLVSATQPLLLARSSTHENKPPRLHASVAGRTSALFLLIQLTLCRLALWGCCVSLLMACCMRRLQTAASEQLEAAADVPCWCISRTA